MDHQGDAALRRRLAGDGAAHGQLPGSRRPGGDLPRPQLHPAGRHRRRHQHRDPRELRRPVQRGVRRGRHRDTGRERTSRPGTAADARRPARRGRRGLPAAPSDTADHPGPREPGRAVQVRHRAGRRPHVHPADRADLHSDRHRPGLRLRR